MINRRIVYLPDRSHTSCRPEAKACISVESRGLATYTSAPRARAALYWPASPKPESYYRCGDHPALTTQIPDCLQNRFTVHVRQVQI